MPGRGADLTSPVASLSEVGAERARRPLSDGAFGERIDALYARSLDSAAWRQAAERARAISERLLESLAGAALILDASARILAANRRGAALLARGEGLALDGGYLRAERPRESQALWRLLRSAGAGAEAGVLALARPVPRAPLLISATPLAGRGPAPPASEVPEVLVLLCDPEELPLPDESVLGRLYGLTPAEARVSVRLAQGDGLRQIAAAHGVGRATVRTQLQQALAKTGTHRQAELVRLLLGLAATAAPATPR